MEKRIEIKDKIIVQELFGNLDKNIKFLESKLNLFVYLEENEVVISGELSKVLVCENVINYLVKDISRSKKIDINRIEYLIHLEEKQSINEECERKSIVNLANGKKIIPKTLGQEKYIDLIYKNTVVFGTGPAGTGKTFLAVAAAARYFKNRDIKRIVITRPAIEAGESLGFLPGDMQEKVDPYLRPVFDALILIFGNESFEKMREKGSIEIAPLAYMRGRTLDDSFIILDEAQNTTIDQMKMFLTRIGTKSKVVVNGDITQIDLRRGVNSGLSHAINILSEINGISIFEFKREDVMRHHLVKAILKSYEESELA